MNRIVFTLCVWLFPAACTALGAAGVFLLRRQTRPATRRILCGMAAGIMLAASVWSLLLPAIARSQGRAAWVPPALGLILGAVGLLRLEDAAGQRLAGGPGHCGRMVLAVTLHNLPEGMVVGLAAALALKRWCATLCATKPTLPPPMPCARCCWIFWIRPSPRSCCPPRTLKNFGQSQIRNWKFT